MRDECVNVGAAAAPGGCEHRQIEAGHKTRRRAEKALLNRSECSLLVWPTAVGALSGGPAWIPIRESVRFVATSSGQRISPTDRSETFTPRR